MCAGLGRWGDPEFPANSTRWSMNGMVGWLSNQTHTTHTTFNPPTTISSQCQWSMAPTQTSLVPFTRCQRQQSGITKEGDELPMSVKCGRNAGGYSWPGLSLSLGGFSHDWFAARQLLHHLLGIQIPRVTSRQRSMSSGACLGKEQIPHKSKSKSKSTMPTC